MWQLTAASLATKDGGGLCLARQREHLGDCGIQGVRQMWRGRKVLMDPPTVRGRAQPPV